ncbi:MAG: hypothetical protein ABI675_02385 [Chitinophagaceae bacterium]
MRLSVAFIAVGFAFIFIGCKKENTSSAPALYGTWIKGNQYGDTLQFMRKNNQDILRTNNSFNPLMQAYREQEYRFRQGKLEVKLFSPTSQEFYPVDSFTWTQAGSEFKIQGAQLFFFMSSINTYYTYRKI